jgi:streptomycin 3"-adenylyltransferase
VPLPPRESVDHSPGRPQHWADVDDDIRVWTEAIVERAAALDGVAGVYLHGSLAMGGFHRPKSDLDLLVVTEVPLADHQRSGFAAEVLWLFDRRPIVGGVELSVVMRESVETFRHPIPYELHFSEEWADAVRRGAVGPRGTDRDLAAHCAVVRSRGVALAGAAPGDVFGEVPEWAYRDAIVDDLRWIVDGGIVASPFYGVLNVCRCALVLLGNPTEPPSKAEAGEWALDHLPARHRGVIADALACYRSAAPVSEDQRRHHGHAWDEAALVGLADWARGALLLGAA